MPVVIQTTSDGERTATVTVGDMILNFRTYYSSGQSPVWLLDLLDVEENPLISGIALLPGSDNVLKGQGDILKDFQLYVLTMDDNPGDENALGNTLQLIMYAPGEGNLFQPGDPLLYLGSEFIM